MHCRCRLGLLARSKQCFGGHRTGVRVLRIDGEGFLKRYSGLRERLIVIIGAAEGNPQVAYLCCIDIARRRGRPNCRFRRRIVIGSHRRPELQCRDQIFVFFGLGHSLGRCDLRRDVRGILGIHRILQVDDRVLRLLGRLDAGLRRLCRRRGTLLRLLSRLRS